MKPWIRAVDQQRRRLVGWWTSGTAAAAREFSGLRARVRPATSPPGPRSPRRPLSAREVQAAARHALGRLRTLAAALPGGPRPWISLLTLGFVMAVLTANGRDLLQLQPDGQGLVWLVLATGLTLMSLVSNGLALAVLLRWLGSRPRWEGVVTLFVTSNLRKYLPGGIWHLVARLDGLRGPEAPLQTPLRSAAALMVVVLEPLLAATAALALLPLGGWQNGLGLLGLVPLLLLLPSRLTRLLPLLEQRRAVDLGLEASAADAAAPALPGYPWPPLLAQLLFVVLRFSGFVCCVLAFDLQGIVPWTTWLAGFVLAWTAGLLVPGAPGGLGVFETVLLLRLRVVLPDAQLLAVALSYRLISTLADLLGAGLVAADRGLPRWLTSIRSAVPAVRPSGAAPADPGPSPDDPEGATAKPMLRPALLGWRPRVTRPAWISRLAWPSRRSTRDDADAP